MDAPPRYTSREMKIVLIACCAGGIIMPLMSTMMNLALVSIGHEFDVGSHSLAMVNTSFLLASVIAMVPIAKLSDIYGRKLVFVIGLAITLVSSILAGFSPSFNALIIMRLAMGVGSAAITSTSIAMIAEIFPSERRGWAIGVQTTFIYLGMAIGPTLGGFMSDLLGWRSLFYFMVPLSALAIVCIMMFKKDVVSKPDEHLNLTGSLLYGITIVLTMYGAINLPATWAFALIAIGLVALCFFITYTRRNPNPILDLKMFKNKVFSRSCIASFINYAASFSVSFFMALYLQNIGALSATQAGMVMLIQPAVQVILSAKAGSYSDRIDARILPTAGMLLVTIAVFMIIFLGDPVNLYYVAVILILLGLGYAMFSAPNTNTMMSSVPARNRGDASGIVSVVRQLGMMVSMGIAMCIISVIMGSTDNITPATFGEFLNVIKITFSLFFVMCIIGTICSWFRGENTVSDKLPDL